MMRREYKIESKRIYFRPMAPCPISRSFLRHGISIVDMVSTVYYIAGHVNRALNP